MRWGCEGVHKKGGLSMNTELARLLAACDLSDGDNLDADLQALAIVADWLEENGRAEDAVVVREWVAGPEDNGLPEGGIPIFELPHNIYIVGDLGIMAEHRPDGETAVTLWSVPLLQRHGERVDGVQ